MPAPVLNVNVPSSAHTGTAEIVANKVTNRTLCDVIVFSLGQIPCIGYAAIPMSPRVLVILSASGGLIISLSTYRTRCREKNDRLCVAQLIGCDAVWVTYLSY